MVKESAKQETNMKKEAIKIREIRSTEIHFTYGLVSYDTV
jgi:hypothetical protein